MSHTTSTAVELHAGTTVVGHYLGIIRAGTTVVGSRIFSPQLLDQTVVEIAPAAARMANLECGQEIWFSRQIMVIGTSSIVWWAPSNFGVSVFPIDINIVITDCLLQLSLIG